MRTVFTGAATALATPFTSDGVDLVLLEKWIDRQIEAGVDALVVLGTTGEPCTMTLEERKSALCRAVERADGRVKVIAGAGSNDTAQAMANARMARAAGADALLVVTPYYNKCTQAGLIAHFQAVAEAGGLPAILYNVPSRTGLNMLPETAARLAEHPLIWGLKEACGDIVQLGEAARLLEGKAAVYAGNDEMCLPAIALGAQGVVSVTANVAPRLVADMTRAALAGETRRALALNRRLAALNRLLFCEVSPIPCKAALGMMGLGDWGVRPPLTPLTQANGALLQAELARLGLAVSA